MNITAKATYKSAKLTASNKAWYINRWHEFHEAFPHVSMAEWCRMRNLSATTFGNWLKEPRWNKELRESKASVSAKPFAEPAASDEIIAEQPELPLEDDTASSEEPDTLTVEASASVDEPLKTEGAYVVYTSADCRIEFSKEMSPEQIASILDAVRKAS